MPRKAYVIPPGPRVPYPAKNQREPLTDAMAKAAALPEQRDYIIWDSRHTSMGFGLRVYASGRKTWLMQKWHAGASMKYVLGEFPDTTRMKALANAQERLDEFNKGLNPHEERRKREAKSELTIERIFDEYTDARRDIGKERTTEDREKARARLASGKLWHLPFDAITGADLHDEWQRLLTKATKGSGKTVASTTFRYLRAAWNHAVARRQLLLPPPFGGFAAIVPGWSTTNKRKRIVATHEGQLVDWWRGVEALRLKDPVRETADGNTRDGRRRHAGTIADYLQLSLLIGPRGGELLPLRWSDVNLDAQLITFKDTKGGRDHIVPYGPFTHDLLTRRFTQSVTAPRQSEFVFPSSRKNTKGAYSHLVQPQNTINWVIGQSKVPFSKHDLRRTFTTFVNELPYITTTTLERLINHAPTTVAGQHYIQSRIKYVRPLFHSLEGRILQEAGALPDGYKTQRDLTTQDIAALTAIAAEDWNPEEPAPPVPAGVELPPVTGMLSIRIRRDGALYIASLDDPTQGHLEAEGASAAEARDLLKELL